MLSKEASLAEESWLAMYVHRKSQPSHVSLFSHNLPSVWIITLLLYDLGQSDSLVKYLV